VQVDRALVGRVHRARERRRCRAARPSRCRRSRSRRGSPSAADLRGGELLGRRRDERAAGAPGGRSPATSSRAVACSSPVAEPLHGASAGFQRPVVRGAEHVAGLDLLVRGDRGSAASTGRSRNCVRVAAEELVERVLAGDVDREPPPAPSGPGPTSAAATRRAGERDADRRVERSRCRSPARARRSTRRPSSSPSRAAARARAVAAACSPRGRERSARPARRGPCPRARSGELRHQLDRLARLHEHDRARVLRDELGRAGRRPRRARSGGCRASRR
jgi:hypothetical protein